MYSVILCHVLFIITFENGYQSLPIGREDYIEKLKCEVGVYYWSLID